MKAMIAFVEDLLAFHTRGNPGVQIVRDPVEGNHSCHDRRGVLGGVEDAWCQHGFIPPKQAGLRFERDRRLLPPPGAEAKHAAPFGVHRFDVANGRDQVGYLLGRLTISTPDVNIFFSRGLLAVLDFGDLGAMPPGQRRKLSTG